MTHDSGKQANRNTVIENLPSIKKLRLSAAALNAYGKLFGRKDIADEVERINSELDRIVLIVERFYALLGARNWVFSDSLNLNRMQTVVSKSSPDTAEDELIAYFQEDGILDGMITRLNRYANMHPRLPLLKKAANDFIEKRYYSSVLVVVSLMDGFVNDSFKAERKGLHARSAEDLLTSDCVATVWEGLPSIQKTFTKPVHARIDDPVYDVFRHGIMHGMVVDYDNVIVAAKAWCMLFAICDWFDAKSKDLEEKAKEPQPLFQTLKRASEVFKKNGECRARLDKWQPYCVDLNNPDEVDVELIESCAKYFGAWRSGNYGELGTFFPNYANLSKGKMAGEARSSYSMHPISDYKIEAIKRTAAAVAMVRVKLMRKDCSWRSEIRFVRMNGKMSAADWEPGEWKVMHYSVDPFKEIRQDSN